MLELGKKYALMTTGLGVEICGFVVYQNGCVSYQCQPVDLVDGKTPKKIWVDHFDIVVTLVVGDHSVWPLSFGDVAKDDITGFEGVVVSRYEYKNGTVQYGLQSRKLKDGVPLDVQHFDEQRLVDDSKVESGGPAGHEPPKSRPSNR